MSKCGYPPCVVQIESGGDNPPSFCEKHLAVKCNYPPCQNTIEPHADVCAECLEFVKRFDWIHGVRHTQVAQQIAEQQYQQRLMEGLRGKKS